MKLHRRSPLPNIIWYFYLMCRHYCFFCVILCAFGPISGVTSKIQHCRLPTQCSWAIYINFYNLIKLITIAHTQFHFLSIFITNVCPKMLQRLEIKTKSSSGILAYVPSSLFFCVLSCVLLARFPEQLQRFSIADFLPNVLGPYIAAVARR